MGKFCLGGMSKNVESQFFDSPMRFPVILTTNLKMFPSGITDLSDLIENPTNIQERDRALA